MGVVLPNKRLVVARCKLCGRVYWHFSDEEPFEDFEWRLKQHLWWHVNKGKLSREQAKDWRDYFDLLWVRVYNPTELPPTMTQEQFEALHPEYIPLMDYEQLKMMARTYPPGFIKILKNWFKAKESL